VKPLFWHPQARLDADNAAAWYARQGGVKLELAFTDALQAAVQRLAQYPAIGSGRCAEELDIPFLRQWPVRNFPHLVFYIERPGQLDVWRVLHTHSDVPAWMADPAHDPKSPAE
jgi:toxin ParE1/3/4